MKAIIMAGGEGVRLRPITSGKPKPMTEIFGKPVCQYTVELLKKYGFTDICFTLRYMPEKIMEYFGNGESFGVNIRYRIEEKPMGTAGGVRGCLNFLGGEDALILSGDAICDFDLGSIVESYKRNYCEGLVVLYEHPEPTEYGIVITDEESGRIKGFSEKPSWDRVTTDRINTGIYVLKNNIIAKIPENIPWDFGKNVFPILLAEEKWLYGYCADGYWRDIGSPESYRQCCVDIMNGKTKIEIGAPQVEKGVFSLSDLPENAGLVPPVYIGRNCKIDSGSFIRSSVIGDGSNIGSGSEIKNSIILESKIGEKVRITDSVVCPNTVVENRAELMSGCVIGEGATIGESSVIAENVSVYPKTHVKSGESIYKDVFSENSKWEFKVRANGETAGRCLQDITTDMAEAWGKTLGKNARVGVAQSGGDGSRMLAESFEIGVNSVGGEVFETDAPFEAILSFETEQLMLDYSLFFREENGYAIVSFFKKNGAFCTKELERKLKSKIQSETEKPGGKNALIGSERMYITGIAKTGKISDTEEKPFTVIGRNSENRVLKQVLETIGGKVEDKDHHGIPTFDVKKGGFSVGIVDETGLKHGWDEIRTAALYCALKRRTGETFMVPSDAPDGLDDMAKNLGGSIQKDDSGERLFSQRFMMDGIFAAGIIWNYITENDISVHELMRQVPKFTVDTRKIKVNMSSAGAMRELTTACKSEFSTELAGDLKITGYNAVAHVSPTGEKGELNIRCQGKDNESRSKLIDKIAHIAESL